jgi:predicted Zn-dependent protease with MMP-like domain
MQDFQRLVSQAIDALPEWLAPIIGEMAILVEDVPPSGATSRGTMLLGQYRGIPRTRYGRRVPGSLPDTITLFRLPILAACREPGDVPGRVLKVLGHEVGHAMGLGEARLRELGWD